MRRRHLAGLGALAVAALLATAAQARPQLGAEVRRAGADSTPFLFVSRSDSSVARVTTVFLTTAAPQTSASVARIALEVPKGYTMQFARPAGSPIGYGAVFPLDPAQPSSRSGTIRIADPNKLAPDPAAQACDPGAHVGVWELDLTAKDAAAVEVPIFVDAAGGGDPADAGYRLQLCPPASLGTGVLALAFSQPIVAEPTTPGSYTWHALLTPAVAGGSGPDPAQTFELRSVVRVPQSLNLHASFNTKTHTATLSGVATELGHPMAGLTIYFDAASPHSHAHLDPVTTDTAGRYSTQWVIAEETDFTAYAEPMYPGACSTAPVAPAGCLSESVSTPPSATVTVKVPLRTDAKRLLSGADRAAAERVNLKPTDLPAGWSSQTLAADDFEVCPRFHPDESRLTVTGISQSPLFSTGDYFLTSSFEAAAAVVKVWQTPAQARSAFAHEASMGQVQCIVDDAGEDYTVLGSGPIPLGKLARVARGFRVIIRDTERSTIVYLDLIVVLGKRSVVTLILESSKTAPSVELPVVARLAARAARV